MLGIDKLKKDVVVVAKLAAKLDKALEDDKVSLAEWVSLTFELPGLIKVAKNYKDSWQELKDLTENEATELAEFFAQEFEISNEQAENVVEQAVNVILALVSVMLAVKE